MRHRFIKTICLTVCIFSVLLAGCGKQNFSASRNIAVTQINGDAEVTSADETNPAYVGEHLMSGDMVDVFADSDMTLELDLDKHIYAGQNTHFSIEATGIDGATKTIVAMDEGSTLISIENKLNGDESFEVSTPNSTIAVRGTTFTVEVTFDVEGIPTTTVEVMTGEVGVRASKDGKEQAYSVSEGKYISLRGNNGDVDLLGLYPIGSNEEQTLPTPQEAEDEWAQYYTAPEDGYFIVKGTVYYAYEYYADKVAEAQNAYGEVNITGMMIVFDEPQNYNGEMIDRCCFLFRGVDTPEREKFEGRHMEFYGFWGDDHEEQEGYDMTMDVLGNQHTFCCNRFRPVE